VEDCVEKVPNRFSLVLLSAHRARAISAGSQILVDRDNDKNPVVALREIAEDVIDAEGLKETLIGTLRSSTRCSVPISVSFRPSASVVALREIAEDVIDAEGLKETLIGTLQRVDERSEAEE